MVLAWMGNTFPSDRACREYVEWLTSGSADADNSPRASCLYGWGVGTFGVSFTLSVSSGSSITSDNEGWVIKAALARLIGVVGVVACEPSDIARSSLKAQSTGRGSLRFHSVPLVGVFFTLTDVFRDPGSGLNPKGCPCRCAL